MRRRSNNGACGEDRHGQSDANVPVNHAIHFPTLRSALAFRFPPFRFAFFFFFFCFCFFGFFSAAGGALSFPVPEKFTLPGGTTGGGASMPA